MKKSSLLAAASALTVVSAFAVQPAAAKDWSHIYDNGSVDWHFTNHDIDLTINPDDFTVSAVSSVFADQLFAGNLTSSASAVQIQAEELSNAASSVANVASIAGDSSANDGKSPFIGVVDTVQKAYGTFGSTASVSGAKVYGDVASAVANSATSAANVISLDTTQLALVDAHQTTGAWWHPSTLNSTATLGQVDMIGGGDVANTASSVGNVVSVNVAPAAAAVPTSPTSHFGNPFPSVQNGIKPVSLALVDVTQTTFANMTSVASATSVNTAGGAFSNAATSAANVVSVINKK